MTPEKDAETPGSQTHGTFLETVHSTTRASLKEKLTRVRHIPALARISAFTERLSSGDRAVFYVLVALVCIFSFASFATLESSLLVSVPAYGGSLIEGEVGNPQFINPLLALSDADRDLQTLTYAGLMGLKGDGSLELVLASSYAMSADGKQYTFTLRPDAVFTDGTQVTADDVVFTVQKAQDPALKSPLYAEWAGVRVVALDPETVRFTLSKAYAPFLGLITLGILPAHIWKNISDSEFPFSPYQTKPVSAGPFVVSDVSRDDSGLIQKVTLKANKDFVLGRPYLDTLVFRFYANNEDLTSALARGAVQSAYGIPHKEAHTAPYARVFGVFLNPDETPVFAKFEVRKALSLAIDRNALIDSVLGGYATAIMGPVPPGEGVVQTSIPKSENHTKDASEVLVGNGWAYDGSARAWKNASTKQSLSSITIRTSNVPELKAVATAVKNDWEKLGITVNIELYEPGDLSQNVIRPRKYEALLYGMVIGRDQDLYAFWDSQERSDPGLNIALYANKTVDTLLEKARASSNVKDRTGFLQKIEDTVASDYPASFLYAPNFIYAVPLEIKNIVLPQIITPADRFANVRAWYRYTDRVWPFFTNKE